MERLNFQVIEKKWQDKFVNESLYRKDGKKFYIPRSEINRLEGSR